MYVAWLQQFQPDEVAKHKNLFEQYMNKKIDNLNRAQRKSAKK